MQKMSFPKNRSLEQLLAQLTDSDPKTRRGAAYVLGTKGGEGALEGLVARLNDESAFVRRWVADALGRLGDKRAIPALENALQHDTDWEVRTWVAAALGRLSETANEAVLTALTDADPRVVAAAANALETIGDSHALPALETVLQRLIQKRAQHGEDLQASLQGDPNMRAVVQATTLMMGERDAQIGQAAAEQAVTQAIASLKAQQK